MVADETSAPAPFPPTKIVTAREAELSPALAAAVLDLQLQAWPGSQRAARGEGHDPALSPIAMLLLADERVVAALAVLSKEIDHRGERYAASGLSTVVTDASQRRRGYGTKLVAAARELVAASGVDLGIFTCDAPLLGFYESAGWEHLTGTVLVGGTPSSPLASDEFDKVTLGGFFSDRARRHRSAFVGSRIALYPGEIDRLW